MFIVEETVFFRPLDTAEQLRQNSADNPDRKNPFRAESNQKKKEVLDETED